MREFLLMPRRPQNDYQQAVAIIAGAWRVNRFHGNIRHSTPIHCDCASAIADAKGTSGSACIRIGNPYRW